VDLSHSVSLRDILQSTRLRVFSPGPVYDGASIVQRRCQSKDHISPWVNNTTLGMSPFHVWRGSVGPVSLTVLKRIGV